ncbi:MAG: MFS transporter, partial [Oscillospiraceae bacterium]
AMLFSKIIAGSANGWAQCYFVGGIIILVVGCAITLLLVKKAPQLYGQTPYIQESSKSTETQKDAATRDDWEGVSKGVAFKSVGFFALAALILLLGCAVTGVTSHVLNYLVTLGWTTTEAGNVFSVFSLLGIIGLLAGGVLFEKVGPRNGIIIACGFYIIGIGSLLFAQNPIFGYVYAVFFALGGMMPRLVPTLLTSVVFGTKDYASIYAILNMVFLVGCSFG